jgi:hypothetical protein
MAEAQKRAETVAQIAKLRTRLGGVCMRGI